MNWKYHLIPRWMQRVYAATNGYFWLPCPICKQNFGGHEWRLDEKHVLYTSAYHGIGVCPQCGDKAHKLNREHGFVRGVVVNPITNEAHWG